ncbi:MAG: DNA mismatch repair protein MutS [Massiliimalia sp.]|jgi:DNA mismatch repair protein MutS
MSKLSPMMQQYLSIKALHQDHILFFRLGDFYEMFFEDAKIVSRELELTLTGKDCGLPERAPMCGVPYHSAATYLKRLIDRGYKVAICEQTEDPSKAKGLVKRDVIRLVTPGTVIEGDMLEDAKNNYIASFYVKGNTFTVCFADISTGDVSLTSRVSSNLSMDFVSELSKFMPSEVLVNQDVLNQKDVKDFLEHKLRCVYSTFEKEQIELSGAEQILKDHFKTDDLSLLGIPEDETAYCAFGGLIVYLNATQHEGAKRIAAVHNYTEDQYMNIDITARRNLEITETIRSQEKRGTLLWVLDKTKTAMGKRFIRQALEQPLMNLAEIIRRQNAVRELTEHSVALSDLQDHLSGVYDLERLMTRVLYNSASPKDLRALSATASKLPGIRTVLKDFSTDMMKNLYENIDVMEDIQNLVDNAIVEDPPFLLKDGGYIRTGFNATLDELRELCSNAKGVIHKIEEEEKEKTGIKGLKIKYNRVFGYYIEVTNSNLSLVPDRYIRKQTLTNCERYITEELKDLESRILTASEKIIALENEIFSEVRKYISDQIEKIQRTAGALSKLDFLCSLAFIAQQNQYVCPQMSLDGKIDIRGGRHPVVEQMLDHGVFVPNDTYLDQKDDRVMIITGPNMAGKSTYMRQVAIISIMAQIGSFVPAQSAKLSIVDKIFTRVGASDDLAAGQSTFMVEMSEVSHILKYATPRSLVVLDEIGRGTSTFDGMSIAQAVVEYLVQNKNLRCKTLFATHYHELTSLEQELSGIRNYNIAVKKRGDDITFLRKIVPGGADDSFGIQVAKLAGIPDKVITRAKEILKNLEDGKQIEYIEKPAASAQVSFTAYTSEIEEKLKALDADALTPLEALNLIYEWKKSMS